MLNFSEYYQQMIQCDCRNFDSYQQCIPVIFVLVILCSGALLCVYACYSDD